MKNIKRLFCVCLIACICFCAVGCNNINDTNSRGMSSNDMTLQEKLDNGLLEKYTLVDGEDILKNVIDMNCPAAEHPDTPIRLITANGSLYELSVNKMYSNGTNFKKIDSDIKFVRFLGAYIIGDNGLTYDYNGKRVEFDTAPFESFGNYKEDVTKLMIFKSRNYPYSENIAIVENKIYNCATNEILYTFEENIKIEYITYYNTIKTNDGWYVLVSECTNQNEVDKYVDVEAVYQLKCIKVQLNEKTTYYGDINCTGGTNGTIIQNGILYGSIGE